MNEKQGIKKSQNLGFFNYSIRSQASVFCSAWIFCFAICASSKVVKLSYATGIKPDLFFSRILALKPFSFKLLKAVCAFASFLKAPATM